MIKCFKIKSQIIFYITIVLSVIVILQIALYTVIRHKSYSIINSIFDSIAQSTVFQIEKLHDDITEISYLLSANSTIQKAIFEYTPAEFMRNKDNIQKTIDEYRYRNENIAMLTIIKNNKPYISSEDTSLYENVLNILDNIKQIKDNDTVFMPAFSYDGKSYFTCITPIFPTNIDYYRPDFNQNCIICFYEMKTLNYTSNEYINSSNISITVTDSDNKIMLSPNHEEFGTTFNIQKYENNFLYKTSAITATNWFLTVLMPIDNIYALQDISTLFIVIMFIINIIVLLLLLKLLNNIIVKRIFYLNKKVALITKSDSTYRINYEYNDELNEIVNVLNHVLEKIHTLNQEKLNTLNKLYQAELLQKKTRIFYLWGQVSPHFLYNSMSHIQGVAFKYNAKEIVDITISLSKVFRYFSNNLNLSTIGNDLDCAIEYFNIINTRRQNPITLINNVDSEILKVNCLKMIFQPILENALKHAFDLNNSGIISISSVPDDKKAIIEINDNGKGMSENVINELTHSMNNCDINNIQNSEKIGILNIHMRLKLYYNNDCGLQIHSKEGKGTCIRITFDKIPPEGFD